MSQRHPPSSQSPSADEPPPSSGDVGTPRRWRSQELLQGAREVQIEHGGLIYRLQVTSLGKLILTK